MRPDAAGDARPEVAGPSGGVRCAGVSRPGAWVHLKKTERMEKWNEGWKINGLDGGPEILSFSVRHCFFVVFRVEYVLFG